MITFDVPMWIVLSVISSIVLPAVVGLVTTKATNSDVKAILLAALNIAAQLLIALQDALQNHTEWNVGLALVMAAGTFIGSVAMHYGLLKPTGISDKLAGTGRHV